MHKLYAGTFQYLKTGFIIQPKLHQVLTIPVRIRNLAGIKKMTQQLQKWTVPLLLIKLISIILRKNKDGQHDGIYTINSIVMIQP